MLRIDLKTRTTALRQVLRSGSSHLCKLLYNNFVDDLAYKIIHITLCSIHISEENKLYERYNIFTPFKRIGLMSLQRIVFHHNHKAFPFELLDYGLTCMQPVTETEQTG